MENSEISNDYQINHRPSETGATLDDITLDGQLIPLDIYTKPHYYADMNESSYIESFSAINESRGKPDFEVAIYRAGINDQLNNGDWVTLSKDYALEHAEGLVSGDIQVNKYIVKAKDIQFAGDDINEFGFFANEERVKEVNNSLEVIHSVTTLENNKDVINRYMTDIQAQNINYLLDAKGDNDLSIKYDNTSLTAMVTIGGVEFDMDAYGASSFYEGDGQYLEEMDETIEMIENLGITLNKLEGESLTSQANKDTKVTKAILVGEEVGIKKPQKNKSKDNGMEL